MKTFVINPGSTSTKIALFEDGEKLFGINVAHEASDLAKYPTLADQLLYREQTIADALSEQGASLAGCDAFVGRGGGLLPLVGGVYEVSDLMVDHALNSANGVVHPANLGSALAARFAREFGGRAFVVNPPDVDEYQDIARLTGMDGVVRTSHVHALNQKETAIRHAASMGKAYEECNFVVCHLGGGTSIAAHCHGRMIDGNDNVGGEGPMAPTRCGAVPAGQLIRVCFESGKSEKELLGLCMKSGGFVDLLGTSDAQKVGELAEQGDEFARLVWDTMIYQVVKYIGAMAAALHGEVDAILLGGGMVHDKGLVDTIADACSFIAPVFAYPGEFEMEAMDAGARRVLAGQECALEYTGVRPPLPRAIAEHATASAR